MITCGDALEPLRVVSKHLDCAERPDSLATHVDLAEQLLLEHGVVVLGDG